MLWVINRCLINPQTNNMQTIYDVDHGLTDFGRFLFDVSIPLSKIHFRQTGNYFNLKDQNNFDSAARGYAQGYTSFEREITGTPARIEDFRASSREINRTPIIIDARVALGLIEAFVLNHVNTAEPAYVSEIAIAWQRFTKSGSPLAKEYHSYLEKAVPNRLNTTDPANWALNYRPADPEIISMFLNNQARIAKERGIRDYPLMQKKVRAILSAYSRFLIPEIVIFNPQAEQALTMKRQEFYASRRSFLKEAARHITRHRSTMPQHAVLSDAALEEMMRRGTFDQSSDDNRINSLTVEHSVPLFTSDNFHLNYSIQSRLINHDMNTLVHLQTLALGMRRNELMPMIIGNETYYTVKSLGDVWPIVILRSPYENGLSLPFTLCEEGLLKAPYRTREELLQIQRGIIDPKRFQAMRRPSFRR